MSRQRDDDGWAARIAKATAVNVRTHRLDRGMSAQAVANRTAELGHPINRSVIADMESGRRIVLGVADWLVLARALDVPPVDLVFPLTDPEVEVLPGNIVTAWAAHDWIMGARPNPGGEEDADSDGGEAWERAGASVIARRAWESAVAAYRQALGRVDAAGAHGDPDVIEQALEMVRMRRAAVVSSEAQLRSMGIVPPSIDEVER